MRGGGWLGGGRPLEVASIRVNTAESGDLVGARKLQAKQTLRSQPLTLLLPSDEPPQRVHCPWGSSWGDKGFGESGLLFRSPFSPIPTMGFALERFAEAVDPDFQCRLCGQVLEEPLCTPCGHVFCARCLLPWAAWRRRCPLQCQPLAPGDLYRVLPLRSLVQKLRTQCDYRARGCGHSVGLRELAAHVERCDFGPARRRRRRRGCVSGPGGRGGGDASARGGCGSAPGVRRGGTPGVRGGSGRAPGPQVLAWRRREKALLAQLWALQGEVQLTARRYQEKFTQYMAHVRNFARDPGGGRGQVSAEGLAPGEGSIGVERGTVLSGTSEFLRKVTSFFMW